MCANINSSYEIPEKRQYGLKIHRTVNLLPPEADKTIFRQKLSLRSISQSN